MRQQCRCNHEGGVGRALGHRKSRRRRAVERHVLGLQAGFMQKQLHRQVRRTALAQRAVVHLAALRTGPGDEFSHRLGRHPLGVDRQHVGLRGGHHDRLQVARRVVGHLGIQEGRIGQRAVEADRDGVAIGGLGGHVQPHQAAGAGLVVDHHRLAPARGQLVAHQPHDQVERAAGAGGHDDLDRLAGPGGGWGLGQRGQRPSGGQHGGGDQGTALHGGGGLGRLNSAGLSPPAGLSRPGASGRASSEHQTRIRRTPGWHQAGVRDRGHAPGVPSKCAHRPPQRWRCAG